MSNKKVDRSYGYTDEMIERAAHLLDTKVASTATQVARIVCKEFDVEYDESIGRQYRKIFNGSSLLINSVSYQEAVKRELPSKKVYFLTSAQNSTPVNKNLLKNMEVYAEKLDAAIGVIAMRYRNPNLYDEGLKDNYWDKEIEEYLIASRYSLHKNMVIGADVFIPYTTKYPLRVAENLSRDFSFIVGHPKQDMMSVPVLNGSPEKKLYSTGSITVPENYSQTMAGSEAQKEHKMGFLIVIVDGDNVVVRNVEADRKGNFQDILVKVENGKIKEEVGKVKAFVAGDLHSTLEDERVLEKTREIIKLVKPENLVLHDVLSAESISYFTRTDIFRQLELKDKGLLSLEKEIDLSLKMIGSFLGDVGRVVIPRANHHNFIDIWLTREDWKKDINNARIYLRLASIKGAKGANLEKGIYAALVDHAFDSDKVLTLGYDESFRVGGIELSQHGDKGSDGRRGSVVQYRKTGIPHIVGHAHSARKEGDIMVVGVTTKKRLGYNQGYSGWSHLHSIITENNKIQYIQIPPEQ